MTDLDQRVLRVHPDRPRTVRADGRARQVGQDLATLLVDTEHPRRTDESTVLQVLHGGVDRRGPSAEGEQAWDGYPHRI